MLLKFQTLMFLLRLIDIVFAFFFLIILAPIFTILVIFISFDGFPILYLSKRVGINGKIFTMYKFRSMKNLKNKKIKDEKRLNRMGIFLRRTSLDELPQLINVLIGNMSIVGPRALPNEIEMQISKKNKLLRRSIRPGMTGLSQINYDGSKRSIKEKAKLDVEYVMNISIYNYFKILFMTILVLIKRYKRNKKGFSL